MSERRRLAIARTRRPVAVAMRVVAVALAAFQSAGTARRSVFIGPRNLRRVAMRDRTIATAATPPRGCEDLH